MCLAYKARGDLIPLIGDRIDRILPIWDNDQSGRPHGYCFYKPEISPFPVHIYVPLLPFAIYETQQLFCYSLLLPFLHMCLPLFMILHLHQNLLLYPHQMSLFPLHNLPLPHHLHLAPLNHISLRPTIVVPALFPRLALMQILVLTIMSLLLFLIRDIVFVNVATLNL
jgi:hypothetical protein